MSALSLKTLLPFAIYLELHTSRNENPGSSAAFAEIDELS
jgi:hypothetical protein